ncbi:MAG: UDP-N-acetylglucosamine 2-epimerase (non-hydrolyzing) [Bacteroidota bacterium]
MGTRPNFIKVTRFKELGLKQGIDVQIIHTGQHYDANMSHVFFDQFGLRPDHFLNLEKSSPLGQISGVIEGFEQLYRHIKKPQLIIVPGDVNSTLAGAVAANKMGIPLAHLESGLRSFQRDMPEEHNRVVADHLSDFCFVTEDSGMQNLVRENIAAKSFHVGNTMIDTLVKFSNKIDASSILDELHIQPKNYYLVTFHRPENVDSAEKLKVLLSILNTLSAHRKVVFPVHPRTSNNLKKFGLWDKVENNPKLILGEPMGYFEFQKLIAESKAVFTDSGGIQEETTFRQVPCITLRKSTERPVTSVMGSNTLINLIESEVAEQMQTIESEGYKKGEIPPLWDGKTTERILAILDEELF